MKAFKIRTTIEIEIDFNAKNQKAAQKLADKIEVTVDLKNTPLLEEEEIVYISSNELSVDWDIEEIDI